MDKITYNDVTIQLDATEEENFEYSGSSTDHVIESGSTISDHIIEDPNKLMVKGFLSEIQKNGIEDPHFKVLDDLVLAKKNKQLFTVETSYKTYTNMNLESISANIKQGSGTSLFLRLSFKEFVFTKAKETKAPKEFIAKPSQDRMSSKSSKGQVSKSPANNNQASKTTNAGKASPNPNKPVNSTPQTKSWALQLLGG